MAGNGGGDAIDYEAAMPAWRQVAAILRKRIRTGRIQPGRAIPSETQIQQELGVARGTSRKAIALLRDEGLVETVQGRGTYVADPLPPEET